MPEQSYIERLIELGATPVPKEQMERWNKQMKDEVIPDILEAEREQRRLVHNMRLRPIPTTKRG